MPIAQKTITLSGSDPVEVATIRFGRLSAEALDPTVGIEMASSLTGPFVQTTFLFLRFIETFPRGSIFARLVLNPRDPTTADVTFEIRRRGDVTGQPTQP
jgi:hypothetical protein